MRTYCFLACLFLVPAPVPGGTIDLLQRYPTKLTAGDAAPDRARPWEFAPADVFRLSRFTLETGTDLKIEAGPADLGIGHCADGAVWAVLIPRADATLTRQVTNQEIVSHVWLRFHPKVVNHVFPPETVFADGAGNLAAQMRAIANAKFASSWHAGPNAMIPEPKDLTVDADTKDGPRRFFVVDTDAKSARYVAAFENRSVKPLSAFTADAVAAAFDQLWNAFDREYAMFVLRPEVNWAKLREQYRPKALACKSTHEFAEACAEMLKPLRDLHVWMTVAGVNVPVFNRPRSANSNPSAHRAILGELHQAGRVQWAVTSDKVGFIAIYGWNTGPEIPAQVNEALEQMRDTRGLIVDVRLNGGGDEPTAGKVAGRFLQKEFVYSYSQFRNGPSHTNLTGKYERKIGPRGPWRYDCPVILLIGQKCMSSNESFIAMMSGSPQVTIMGDRTCGSSGNPKIIKLPLDMTVSVPRWIDYLPDGKPLDEHGVQPQVRFNPESGAFDGERDDLLTAALERLRQAPLPETPIKGSAQVLAAQGEPAGWTQSAKDLSEYSAAIKEEAQDASRPRVISVSPANEATGVSAVTELRVRFDRPMEPMSLKLDWETGGFLDCEFPKYDSDRQEFTIPVHLAPGALHQIVLNKPLIWAPASPAIKLSETRRQFPREGFQSADHHQVGLFVWQFRTQGTESPPAAQPPKVISISPEPGSPVALLTFVEIQFDQPMAPPAEAIPCVVSVPAMKSPGGICRVQYNSSNHTFRIPLLAPLKDRIRFTFAGRNFEVPPMLTPRENVTFQLAGFRSAKGVAAAPLKIDYRVSETEFARADRKKIETAAEDPPLLAVLDDLRQKRQRLTSVAERVQNLDLGIKDNLFTSLKSQSAVFKWQQPGQFYAEISEVMLSCEAFRIGSDGQSWWFHGESNNGKELQACPVKEMHEVDSSICDPFDLAGKTPAQAAKERGLRYLGLTNRNGTECHALEAWSVSTFAGVARWGELNQWWIDARSALPVEGVKFHEHGLFRTRFLYDAVNTPLAADAFGVPKIEGLPASAPDALDSDYTSRYVVIRDGSDGRMSARWGKQGPKGSSSSGLN